jgi:hypothetical protein
VFVAARTFDFDPCRSVKNVLDFAFWTRSERDRVRGLIASLGGNSVLYRLSCPDEVAWRSYGAGGGGYGTFIVYTN